MILIKNALIFFLLFILASCSVSTKNLPEPDKLKRELANSIEIPFRTGDTIIYQSFIGMCGNSSDDELNRYYEPNLNEQPYFDMLKNKIKRTTFYTGDSLYTLMDRLCNDSAAPHKVRECFYKNKIILSMNGHTVTNKSVTIYERYSYNNQYRTIEKLFNYSNDKWTYKIIDDKNENEN